VTGSDLAVDGDGPLREPLTYPLPERVVEVVAAVIERAGRILIARRRAGGHLGGRWEFPGGKRQAGETPEAALVREIREELDVAVTVGELLDDVEWTYPEKTVRLLFFRCALAAEAEGLASPIRRDSTCRWVSSRSSAPPVSVRPPRQRQIPA
jgi:mutator protein MutT